jgi:hypothetical protein
MIFVTSETELLEIKTLSEHFLCFTNHELNATIIRPEIMTEVVTKR